MNDGDQFYTMKGYELHETSLMTSAMEDYLEMAARLSARGEAIRVTDLSGLLHVKASSVTKMLQQLSQLELLHAEKYGHIFLTEKGAELGGYLLHRHEVIHRFLCLLNQSENELEETEKIEHFLSRRTVANLEVLNAWLNEKKEG